MEAGCSIPLDKNNVVCARVWLSIFRQRLSDRSVSHQLSDNDLYVEPIFAENKSGVGQELQGEDDLVRDDQAPGPRLQGILHRWGRLHWTRFRSPPAKGSVEGTKVGEVTVWDWGLHLDWRHVNFF